MHPADIKAAVAKTGYTYEMVLNRLRVDRKEKNTSIVSSVVNGKVRNRRVESVISEITGLSPQTLWPQWYPAKADQQAA